MARASSRRAMPRVAIASGALFIIWLFAHESRIYRDTFIGQLLGPLTFFAVFLTILYYGFRALRWLKRRLLWRVRRRLIITYLFVGLTPIVLLTILGLFAAMGGSQQGLARVVAVQLNTVEIQALNHARALADALERQPLGADQRSVQTWLDEETALMQAALPGACVALWRRAAAGSEGAVGHEGPAPLISQPEGEDRRGVGGDATPVGAPLPEWLRGKLEWNGLAFVPPAESSSAPFGSPSVRALVRRRTHNRDLAVLVVVPISRALIQQMRDSTGAHIHPFFLGARNLRIVQQNGDINFGQPTEPRDQDNPHILVIDDGKREITVDLSLDQFGERLTEYQPFVSGVYPMIIPATDWTTGSQEKRMAFLIDWSWAEASEQFLGDRALGEVWKIAIVFVGALFLGLELVAVFSAAWMTRAVTGTVHRLYRATEHIKRGDFSYRVRVRSHDQLGELAAAFNEMSADIEALLKERVERERLEREVEIAAEVQAQFFPREVPKLTSVEITGECRAARGVAGDYYDYVEVAPGVIAIALGDVSGKGISASLVMSNLQAALRAQTSIVAERLKLAEHAAAVGAGAGSGDQSFSRAGEVSETDLTGVVAGMTAEINEQLCRSTDENRFATLFLALYDDRTGSLRYTNAGHNAAILVHADGAVERLTAGGMMVGSFVWASYEEAHTRFAPGDLLLIFSDGFSEAQNAAGEEYGEERLVRFAVDHRALSASELRGALYDEIVAWSAPVERADDQTLVVVKAVSERQ